MQTTASRQQALSASVAEAKFFNEAGAHVASVAHDDQRPLGAGTGGNRGIALGMRPSRSADSRRPASAATTVADPRSPTHLIRCVAYAVMTLCTSEIIGSPGSTPAAERIGSSVAPNASNASFDSQMSKTWTPPGLSMATW